VAPLAVLGGSFVSVASYTHCGDRPSRWAIEVGGKWPLCARTHGANSTSHKSLAAYHRSCPPPRADCALNRLTCRANMSKKAMLPLTSPRRPSPLQSKLLSVNNPSKTSKLPDRTGGQCSASKPLRAGQTAASSPQYATSIEEPKTSPRSPHRASPQHHLL